MKPNWTPRIGYLTGFLTSGGLILFALYLQYYEYQNPCPLCILQRVVYIALMVGVPGRRAARPAPDWRLCLQHVARHISLTGAGIATRHVWLQHLPKDKVPECGPGLAYMLDRFPLIRRVREDISRFG